MHPNLLEGLNEEQQAAVTHGDGPLLILAGAGTGKTTVITRRIGWLIQTERCKTEEVLALTFTDKAATEMEERVDRLLPYGYVTLWISTFHGFCEKILRRHALDIGLSPDFKVLNQTGSWLLIRRNLDRFQLAYYKPLGNPTKFIHALIQHFSRAKDEDISPTQYGVFAESALRDGDSTREASEEVARIREVADAYHQYELLLHENNALDFGSLISYTLKLFRDRPALLERYRRQFKYILVDEFQDTNGAQYALVKLLAGTSCNLTVVGDDDQAVYSWRGASLSNILEFQADFPQSTNVVLVQNYRSRQIILDTAYAFIQKNNPNRLEYRLREHGRELSKKLQSATDEPGFIEHVHGQSLMDEVEGVLSRIIKLRQQEPELSWSSIAILVRSNDTAQAFLAACDEVSLPYQFVSVKGFYSKPIILDVCAYLRVLLNFHDSPSLYRILSLPEFGLSHTGFSELSHYAVQKGYTLWRAASQRDSLSELSDEDKAAIVSLTERIESHGALVRTKRPSEVLQHIVTDLGILSRLSTVENEENREALELLQQLIRKMQEFQKEVPHARLADFMGYISFEQEAGDAGSIVSDDESASDAVRIMTIHASKGLEFDYVFIVNLVDRRFPTIEREEGIPLPKGLHTRSDDEDGAHLEEERRLFYVALTRARKGVYLTSAEDYGGTRMKKRSRFLDELELPIQNPTVHEGLLSRVTESSVSSTPSFSLPSAFSFSQLSVFQKCPLQYKFKYLLRIPTFGRWQSSYGDTIHKTLQAFVQLIQDSQEADQQDLFKTDSIPYTEGRGTIPALADLLAIYTDKWIDDWYPSDAARDLQFSKGKALLTRYYAELVANPPRPKSLEQEFTIPLGAYRLKGRIDRIDHGTDGVSIIDYKTGDSAKAIDKDQLTLYQIAAEEAMGERVERLAYVFPEDGVTQEFLATEKDKDKFRAKVEKTIDELKQSDFAPTPSRHVCQFCDFKDICEAKKL